MGTGQRRADQPARYSGQTKIAVCNRLLTDWSQLADYLDALPDRARFDRGREPQGVWEWLEAHGRLADLAGALAAIGRTILWRSCSPALARPTAASSACPGGSAWRGAQTLLPGLRSALVGQRYAWTSASCSSPCCWIRGRCAGPRWQRGSETLHDLGEVLARVPEPAVVVLGPPGSGKSTLLRHYELDCAQAALAGQAGADLSQAPLTFFVSLYDYKPASANAPAAPQDWLAAQWAARYPELPGLDVLLRRGA